METRQTTAVSDFSVPSSSSSSCKRPPSNALDCCCVATGRWMWWLLPWSCSWTAEITIMQCRAVSVPLIASNFFSPTNDFSPLHFHRDLWHTETKVQTAPATGQQHWRSIVSLTLGFRFSNCNSALVHFVDAFNRLPRIFSPPPPLSSGAAFQYSLAEDAVLLVVSGFRQGGMAEEGLQQENNK